MYTVSNIRCMMSVLGTLKEPLVFLACTLGWHNQLCANYISQRASLEINSQRPGKGGQWRLRTGSSCYLPLHPGFSAGSGALRRSSEKRLSLSVGLGRTRGLAINPGAGADVRYSSRMGGPGGGPAAEPCWYASDDHNLGNTSRPWV